MNQNEAILLAKELELYIDGENTQAPFWVLNHEELTRFANLVASREREACAQLCQDWGYAVGLHLAATIRERGVHESR